MSSPPHHASHDLPPSATAAPNERRPGTARSYGAASDPLPGDETAPAVVVSIAGFDPSSGAGLTADLKVFAAHRLYGVAAATALTVQSTRGVRRSVPVEAALLEQTLACLAEDLPLAGIKIGMLATAANVEMVARFLQSRPSPEVPVVLDPVLASSSGHALLDAAGVASLREQLLPLVTCVTPNTAELLLLAPGPSRAAGPADRHSIEEAALHLAEQFPGLSIVATGGHLASPDDCVMAAGHAPIWLPGEWVRTPAIHGTGCAYSSALLCQLVAGLRLPEAAQAAKRYVTEALRAAQPIGHGGGSMHHLYAGFPSYQRGLRLPHGAQAQAAAPERDLAPDTTPGRQGSKRSAATHAATHAGSHDAGHDAGRIRS